MPGGQSPYGPPPKRKSSAPVIAAILIVVLVLAGGATGAALLFSGSDGSDSSDVAGTLAGNGYSYVLPNGWSEVTDEALAGNPPGTIDTVSAWGERFNGAPANLIVEIGPAQGASDPEELRQAWESTMGAATNSTPKRIENTTIGDETAIGTEIRRSNENGIDIVQVAYLTVHDGHAYSVALSTNAETEDEARSEFEMILNSWTWE